MAGKKGVPISTELQSLNPDKLGVSGRYEPGSELRKQPEKSNLDNYEGLQSPAQYEEQNSSDEKKKSETEKAQRDSEETPEEKNRNNSNNVSPAGGITITGIGMHTSAIILAQCLGVGPVGIMLMGDPIISPLLNKLIKTDTKLKAAIYKLGQMLNIGNITDKDIMEAAQTNCSIQSMIEGLLNKSIAAVKDLGKTQLSFSDEDMNMVRESAKELDKEKERFDKKLEKEVESALSKNSRPKDSSPKNSMEMSSR